MSALRATISWTMADEKILKLKEPEKTYDISNEVHAYLEKTGLYDKLDDKQVDVEIDEKNGENGTITRLSLVDGKTKVPETKTTQEPTQTTQTSSATSSPTFTKEMTVQGVSVQKKGVKFAEEENWYTLSTDINPQTFKDTCTKKKIQVVISKASKGNDVIMSYVLQATPEKTETVKDEKTTDSSDNGMTNTDKFYRIKELERQVRFLENQKSESYEAQNAVSSANTTVASMITPEHKPEEVLRMITRIAEHNYATIQALKTTKG